VSALAVLVAACQPARVIEAPPADLHYGDRDMSGCLPTWPTGSVDPTLAGQWCDDFYTAYCHRALTDCTAELTVPFATENECTGQMLTGCGSRDWSQTVYVAEDAQSCLEIMGTAACSTFANGALEGCHGRIGLHGRLPDPAGCTVIVPGVHHGAITGAEPTWAAYLTLGSTGEAKPAVTFCLCLVTGDVLTASLAPGASDPLDAYPDLYLVNPYGSVATWGAHGLDHFPAIDAVIIDWTGPHMLIVTPQSAAFDTGTFQLTVAID
jgi:hypothetical protein